MGYPPPDNFEKIGYLTQHFVRFEDSLLGNKEGKNEGSNDNNSGTIKDPHSRHDHIALPEVYKSLARTQVSRATSVKGHD